MTKNTKKQPKKRNYRRTIDLFFLFVLLIVYIYAFYKAFNFKMIPIKYTLIGFTICTVLYLVLFLLALKKMPTWFTIIKRCFIILLCALLLVSTNMVKKVELTSEKIATINSTSFTNLYIITKADSNISSIEDLSQKVIGYQNGCDKTNADYMQDIVQKEIQNSEAFRYLDYTSLYYMLLEGKIDALAISEQYYGMTKATQEDFDQEVKIIHTFKKPPLQIENKLDITKDVFTVYISGIDNAGSPDQMARSDVNLIMIVNPKNHHVDMVSLPRDGYIPNPALSNYDDKLTHTSINGLNNSLESLEQFIGIPIDYYARLSFTSVAQVVDAVGGIDIDVELDLVGFDETKRRVTEENYDYTGLTPIRIAKGPQHLSGAEALVYARHRKTEGYGTEGRERAQRKIIQGVIDKLLSLNAFNHISNLLDIAPNFLVTNMPSDQVSAFINAQLADIKPWSIHSLVSDAGLNVKRQCASLDPVTGPYDVYLFSKEEIHEIINAYDGAKKLMEMESFTFDLDNLYENTPEIPYEDSVEWSNNAPEQYMY